MSRTPHGVGRVSVIICSPLRPRRRVRALTLVDESTTSRRTAGGVSRGTACPVLKMWPGCGRRSRRGPRVDAADGRSSRRPSRAGSRLPWTARPGRAAARATASDWALSIPTTSAPARRGARAATDPRRRSGSPARRRRGSRRGSAPSTARPSARSRRPTGSPAHESKTWTTSAPAATWAPDVGDRRVRDPVEERRPQVGRPSMSRAGGQTGRATVRPR
jgi:hypothetical protein